MNVISVSKARPHVSSSKDGNSDGRNGVNWVSGSAIAGWFPVYSR